jgi:competence protein ComEC
VVSKSAFLRIHFPILIVLAFAAGVFLSSLVDLSINTFLFSFLIFSALLAYGFLTIRETEVRKFFFLFPFLVLALGLGILRYEIKDFLEIDPVLSVRVGERVTLTGLVAGEPEERESFTQVIIKIRSIAINDEETLVEGRVLARLEPYPEVSYGDIIRAAGELTIPGKFETDTGRLFDYQAYLAKDDIAFVLSFAKTEILERGKGNPIKQKLLGFKHSLINNFNKSITEPSSALLSGILLGVESSLGKDLEDKLRQTAIIHIVVLSGYNITLVARFVMGLLFFISRRKALILSVVGIALFAVMVGGGPSVVRASLMGALAAVAGATGRRYDISRALVFAGFLMIFWNPKVLVFDFGFQLSFMATLALIWLAPILEEKLTVVPNKGGLREIASATIATQLFVLPLLLFHTGELSIVGVLVNLLVLPVVPLIMLIGFTSGMLGFLTSWLAFPFAAITQLLLFYVLKVVEFFSSLPLASIRIPYFPLIFMLVLYTLYGFIFLKFSKSIPKNSKSSETTHP